MLYYELSHRLSCFDRFFTFFLLFFTKKKQQKITPRVAVYLPGLAVTLHVEIFFGKISK